MDEEIVRDGTGEDMLRVVRRSQQAGGASRRAHGQPAVATGLDAGRTEGLELRVLPGGLDGQAEGAAPTTRADVAHTLRAARKRKRVTLEQAAEETRLPRRALAAFEGDGDEADLPEPPYDRYFLREYARYLSVPDEPLLGALEERPADELELPLDLLPVERPPRRWPMWLLAVASGVALIVLAVVRMTSSDSPALSASDLASKPAQAPRSVQPAPEPTTVAPAPASPGVSAVLRLTGPCWIEATVDGRVVLTRTSPAGKTLRFHARGTLDLRLGNAGGVQLTVNGKRVATGGEGEVVQLSFRWSDGRVIRA